MNVHITVRGLSTDSSPSPDFKYPLAGGDCQKEYCSQLGFPNEMRGNWKFSVSSSAYCENLTITEQELHDVEFSRKIAECRSPVTTQVTDSTTWHGYYQIYVDCVAPKKPQCCYALVNETSLSYSCYQDCASIFKTDILEYHPGLCQENSAQLLISRFSFCIFFSWSLGSVLMLLGKEVR
eukprot:gb/GECG01009228.1/.p1 GENE.gb/GECG01009228.1/~~gb/GECG01009228.1/.p1  ORF type:complete len:180 (+),score=3.76 gb/GECG01009228.1/:1-540(+)